MHFYPFYLCLEGENTFKKFILRSVDTKKVMSGNLKFQL